MGSISDIQCRTLFRNSENTFNLDFLLLILQKLCVAVILFELAVVFDYIVFDSYVSSVPCVFLYCIIILYRFWLKFWCCQVLA